MKDLGKIFNAVSDVNRLRIIKILHKRRMCVCEITAVMGLAQSTISSHLKILMNAGIIQAARNGKWVDYYLVGLSKRTYFVNNILNLILSYEDRSNVVRIDGKMAEEINRHEVCKLEK